MSHKITSPDGSKLAFERPVLKARDLGDLVQAREAVRRAHQNARKMLDEAKQIRASAYQKGYDEGVKAGSKESASRMMGLVSGSVDYLAQRETEIAAIVVATVEQVLGRIDQDEMILRSVKRSLGELRNQQSVTVRAAPANAKTLLDELPHHHPEIEVLNIVVDERLSGEECVIETDIGIVNINKADFLYALKSSLAQRLGVSIEQLERTVAGLGIADPASQDLGNSQPRETEVDVLESLDFSNLELEPRA